MGKVDKPNAGGGITGSLLRGCVLLVVMGGMFGLGVLTGRGTAPVRFDIQRLEERLMEIAGNAPSEESGAGVEYQFYDELRNNEGSRRPMRVKKAFPRKMEKRIPGRKKSRPEEGKKSSRTVAAAPVTPPEKPPAARPVKKVEKAPKPASSPVKTVTSQAKGGAYAVQVAAFSEKKDATVMVVSLGKKGYGAYRTVSADGKWHRVRIGSFKDRNDAGALLARLKKDNIKAFLVNR